MSSYHAKIDAFLTHYQPELKAELEQHGKLEAYLQEQAMAMAETKQRSIAQLCEKTPNLSQLQAKIEAERIVFELFLTP